MNDMIVLGRVLPINSDKIHQNQEVYDIGGIMATIKATHYKDPPKVMIYGKMDNKNNRTHRAET